MSYTKLIITGDYIEQYTYEKEPPSRKPSHRRKTSVSGRVANSNERRFDNLQRTRKRFVRIVRANLSTTDYPAFLTLTYGVSHTYESAIEDYRVFCKRLNAFFKKDIKIIGVPEFQKRGAVHFHLLVWFLPEYVVGRERDIRLLQFLWRRGYVDIIATDGSPKLANYIAKYMWKSMQDSRLSNKRAYFVSRNCLRPVYVKTSIPDTFIQAFTSGDNSLISSREFVTLFLGKCLYKLIYFKHASVSD